VDVTVRYRDLIVELGKVTGPKVIDILRLLSQHLTNEILENLRELWRDAMVSAKVGCNLVSLNTNKFGHRA